MADPIPVSVFLKVEIASSFEPLLKWDDMEWSAEEWSKEDGPEGLLSADGLKAVEVTANLTGGSTGH